MTSLSRASSYFVIAARQGVVVSLGTAGRSVAGQRVLSLMVGAAGGTERATEEVLAAAAAAGLGADAAASSRALVDVNCVDVLFVEGHTQEVLRDLFVEGNCRGGRLVQAAGAGAARGASGGSAAEGGAGYLL